MVRTILAVAVVMAGVAWAAEDKEKLVGTWTVTASEKDGKRATATDVKGKTVKITADNITCYDGTKTDMACRYTVDTSSKPWKVEMTCTEGEHKDKKLQGIASLDGDTLRICFSKPDKDAPTEFKTADGQCSFTLERSK
jgi:uncharacterized protein (TIGR03067 family)